MLWFVLAESRLTTALKDTDPLFKLLNCYFAFFFGSLQLFAVEIFKVRVLLLDLEQAAFMTFLQLLYLGLKTLDGGFAL